MGDNTLALARPSLTAADVPTPNGSASLQLAFKVSAPEVDTCADELVRHGVNLLSPPTDQVFGHRTLFFRDPDGNLLEVFADIWCLRTSGCGDKQWQRIEPLLPTDVRGEDRVDDPRACTGHAYFVDADWSRAAPPVASGHR